MRIAVASRGLNVSQSFKQSESFTCYNVNHGIIDGCHNLPISDQTPEAMLDVFRELDVQTLIVGRINIDTANYFCDNGVEVIAGANGAANDVAKQYLNQELHGTDESCSI